MTITSLTHQELSVAIGARKAADIAQAGDERPVAHVVELLAAAGEGEA